MEFTEHGEVRARITQLQTKQIFPIDPRPHCICGLSVGSPMNHLMALSLYAANEGHLDSVDVKKVVAFETALHDFARSAHAGVLARIDETGDFNAEIENGLKKIIEDFKATGTW